MLSLRTDYLLHFAFSAVIVFTLAPFVGLWVAVTVSAIIGMLKELIHDHLLGLGQLEAGDFVANGVGIVYAVAVILLGGLITWNWFPWA